MIFYKKMSGDALLWQPELQSADIKVVANEGVITLTGAVESFDQKEETLHVAKSICGVKVVIENIKVKINSRTDPPDEVIFEQINYTFKWQRDIPEDKIQFKVENGWVTLDGIVQWHYQKIAAYKAVTLLVGIKGITNKIATLSQSGYKVDKSDIESALRRNAYTNDQQITVEVEGNRVRLTGCVSSWYQKEEAGRLVWNASGVEQLDNQLVIEVNDN